MAFGCQLLSVGKQKDDESAAETEELNRNAIYFYIFLKPYLFIFTEEFGFD